MQHIGFLYLKEQCSEFYVHYKMQVNLFLVSFFFTSSASAAIPATIDPLLADMLADATTVQGKVLPIVLGILALYFVIRIIKRMVSMAM